jgi:hypothetical protein
VLVEQAMHIVSHVSAQSAMHVAHVSVPLHVPSPQRGGQMPQSSEHVVQVSIGVPLQTPSPQRGVGGHAMQSAGQDVQVSVPLQV